jgi:threonylcarbamoyladenosine tRNA methylthiotransferase MtaB
VNPSARVAGAGRDPCVMSVERPAALRGGSSHQTFSVAALGCRVNQQEVEALRSQLLAHGYREVPFGEPAGLTVVNTCTVTSAGDSDGRQMLRKARRSSPRGRILATGCLAERDPERVAELGVADLVIGNAEKLNLDHYLNLLTLPPRAEDPMPSCSEIVVRSLGGRRPPFLAQAPGVSTARTRAAVKVQDGCDEHCTYCIIPQVRGRSVSRPWREVVAEVTSLVAGGVREITLTGVNTGSYGLDGAAGAGCDLARLVARLAKIDGLERIRISSIEPGLVTDRFLRVFTEERRVCPHLHIPLQSGDDEILKRMGRTYRSGDYAALARGVLRLRPGTTLGADVMVGFPGETDAHFERTRALIESLELSYLHVFSYSPRPGTPAPRLREAVPKDVVAARSRTLRDLDARLRHKHMARRRGQADRILVEEEKAEGFTGLTGDYLRVVVPDTPPDRPTAVGSLLDVRIDAPMDGRRVRATPLESATVSQESSS